MIKAISIPKYSEETFPDKHIAYVIEVKTLRETYLVKHRYSDFEKLHEELLKSKVKFNDKLPPKSGLRSLSKDKLLERQNLLEVYIKQICLHTDKRISENPHLLKFLNLSNETASTADMEIYTIEQGTFMDRVRKLQEFIDTISTHITEKEKKIVNGEDHQPESTEVVKKLSILSIQIRKLFEQLDKEQSQISEGEQLKRRDILQKLKVEHEKLDNRHKRPPVQSQKRDQLFSTQQPRSGNRAFGNEYETEKTIDLNEEEIVQLQREEISKQDQDLESLSQVLSRQLHLSRAIGEELDLQNDMLDKLDTQVDRTQEKLKKAGKQLIRVANS